ncbi:MAG TPA: cytochrome c3 family protein [Terriglobales bacterium]|nr:cytochrome c3 family protein [Terriglobales bacterium]
MYHRQVRCFDCHQVHSNQSLSDLAVVGNGLCITCHTPQSPAGPHSTISEHTHHKHGSVASQWTACDMPKVACLAAQKLRSSAACFEPIIDSPCPWD